ncbi:MAG: cytoplasmic protein [Candidatus Nitrospira kreftii]|uniref:Cytoplasmic protein n=1 Tax=Candidatus Nitrospira kreftii TaxID=2652173 RepID=A0A7S8J0G4_9BACT|nr:MAG: cytoplasmic protein [Candidatus Nitrospira kreftii]
MLAGQRINKIRQRPSTDQVQQQFDSLKASLLFCPRCQIATPTRERLLLVLPSGNLYEYLCAHCGTSTGSKTENPVKPIQIIGP